ncbi:MAG: immunoglobulin domain-containing protein, partial [Verrucomicrobia bacterium]|nr:immunoglobulin domain-containing protein [Verrucomicrobiota bacterium]
MISLSDLSLVATIPVGDRPEKVAATPDGRWVFVANAGSGTVSAIDCAQQSVAATIPVGNAPAGLVLSPDGSRLYVANSGSSSISVIDTSTRTVLTTFPTLPEPLSLAYHPTRNEVWVGSAKLGTLMEVRSASDYSVVAQVTSSEIPAYMFGTAMAFLPDGSEIFAAESCGQCGRFHRLSGTPSGGLIILLEGGIKAGPLGAAYSVAVNPVTGQAYLGKSGHAVFPPDPTVFEYGSGRLLHLTSSPTFMTFDPATRRLWIALAEGAVALADTDSLTILSKVTVGGSPSGIAFGTATDERPAIAMEPQDQTVPWGGTALLSVTASGDFPLSYQWFKSSTNILDEYDIDDATNATLLVTNAQEFDSGGYFVIVTNSYGAATSRVAQLTVKGFIQTQVDAAAPGTTISIPAGQYQEKLVIPKDLWLRGESPASTLLDGGFSGTVIVVSNGVNVTLSDLSVMNGRTTNELQGGGIHNQGTLVVSNCVITGNSALDGGGILNMGTLRIEATTISSNTASLGGALQNLRLSALFNSTLSDNLALSGGAVYNRFGTNALTQCTVSGNIAFSGNGGGVFNRAVLEFQACTVAFNTATSTTPETDGWGGGVFSACGPEVSIPENPRPVVYSRNSLYAENTAASTTGHDFRGQWMTLGHNLVGSGDFTLPGCTDILTTNPNDRLSANPALGPLQDNGGMSMTHALIHTVTPNPAIDAGSSTDLPSTDQRGLPRISDGDGNRILASDIGSFEYQNTPPLMTALPALSAVEDIPITPVSFSLWDQETPPGNLIVSVRSSNTGLVPASGMQLSGVGAVRALTIRTVTNQFGTATLSLVVSDGLLRATNNFLLTVNSMNDLPTISATADRITGQNRPISVPFTIGDVETPLDSLALDRNSSNPTLVRLGGIVFSGTGAHRVASITPAANRSGLTTITLLVADGDGATAPSNFDLVVQAPPVITSSPTNLTTTNGAVASFTGSATGDDLYYQWLFNGTNWLEGATNQFLTLTNVSAANVGTYALVVTNYGGAVTSAPAQLRITALPFIETIADQETVSGLPVGPLSFRVWDAETPASNLVVTATSSDPAVVPLSGLLLGGTG